MTTAYDVTGGGTLAYALRHSSRHISGRIP